MSLNRNRPKTADTRAQNNSITNDSITSTHITRSKTGSCPTSTENEPSVADLFSEIRLLRQDVKDVKSQLSTVSSTLTEKIEEYEKRLEEKDRDIKRLSDSVAELQYYIGTQEQLQMRNEIEIIGLPEQPSENLTHMILVTSKKLGVELQENDIDQVQRVGAKRTNSPSKPPTSRPVVVKLLRGAKRDELLFAAKSRRNLTSSDIVSGTSATVYLNERLSQANRKLFGEARKRATQHNFRYCWIRNGCVYARKAANTTEKKFRALAIRSHDDIDKLIGPAEGTSANQHDLLFRTPISSN
ncbi:hypothetical protein PYW07_008483 [Mythimna separata]|uniref:FP protein C-terminal domain-containing protein n=1 Tax=Mythimna separata TaxID=271217 RepID=A0AAD8DN71_MYTSE|nr:hypothetical protein PYW07_008483 [Mythimna separata]